MSTNKRETQIATALRSAGGAIARAVLAHVETCLTCQHFKEHEGELCGLAGQRPPARVIAYGCPQHQPEPPF